MTPGFIARRRDTFSPAKRAAAWIDLLDRAVELGDLAAGGVLPDRDTGALFAGQAVRTGDLSFPLGFDSARSAASGFRLLTRGFIAAARPELKQALGVAMAAAARCCRRMLEIETEAAAAAQRRRTGEREED